MLNLFEQPSSTIIQRWEEVGSLLASSLDDYLGLSLLLESRRLSGESAFNNLPSRIDHSLLSLHPMLATKLARAHSSLARTRNQLTSPSYRLPAEVLSEIFSIVLYERDEEEFNDMQGELRGIYRRLHCLLNVCSVWRRVGLANGKLWSFVPICYPMSGPIQHQATNLSLQRAGGSALHLAAIVSPAGPVNMEALSEHAFQFRTINISSCNCHSIRRLVNKLLERGTLASVSELSIQQDQPPNHHLHLPEHIVVHDSPLYPQFTQFVRSVSVLRIKGAYIFWDALAFSTQLVELRLQEVLLGPDSSFINLLHILSSVSHLRDLKLISISTLHEGTTLSTGAESSISFPNLTDILLEDLYFNTLKSFLAPMISGSYSLTLYPTQKITQTRSLDGFVLDEDVAPEDVQDLLKSLPINRILIDGNEENLWLEQMGFNGLLASMPSLRTLQVHSWDFGEDDWEGLQRSSESHQRSFPKLEGLHLTCVGIFDEGIKGVVTSHSIQKMVLGANFGSDDDESTLSDDVPEWGDALLDWLASRVPDFRLTTDGYVPSEFRPDEWRLW